MDLITKLYQVEKAVNAVWPQAVACQEARQVLGAAQSRAAYDRKNYKPGVWMLRIGIPMLVLFLGIYTFVVLERLSRYDFYGNDFLEFCLLFGALLAGTAVITGLVLICMFGRGHRAVEKAEKQLKQAEMDHEKVMQAHVAAFRIGHELMLPEAYYTPQHARAFNRYFETGQAKDMAHARDLFDACLHRERMEQHAVGQQRRLDELYRMAQR